MTKLKLVTQNTGDEVTEQLSSTQSVLNESDRSIKNDWHVTLPPNFGDPNVVGLSEGRIGIFSNFTRYMFELVVYTVLCGGISIAGIVANLTNLMVFIRQGILSDSVTATLAGLAVADLCCLLTMLWLSINYAIMLSPPEGLPWDPLSVLYITGGWPHVMFTRVTCWITAYVALERCMCVMLPFKVKQLFTDIRSIVVIGSIFVFIIATYTPIFYTHRLQNVRDPTTNTTKLHLVFTSNKIQVENVCHYINDVILPTCSLCIVIVCTRLTISHLNSSTKWRENNAKTGGIDTVKISKPVLQNDSNANTVEVKQNTTSTKEARVVKMITLICTIFIICNSPCILIIYLRFVVPEISIVGRYQNLFHILYSIDFLLESFNSTINIVVYYKMSSRYKQEFHRLFGMIKGKI